MKKNSLSSDTILFDYKVKKFKWIIRFRFFAPLASWASLTSVDFPNVLETSRFYAYTLTFLLFFFFNLGVHIYVKQLEKGTTEQKNRVNLNRFIFLQGIADLSIMSLYVYLDGGVESAGFFLYGFIVVMTAFLTDKKYGLLTMAFGALSYASISIGELFGILPHNYIRSASSTMHMNANTVFSDTMFIGATLFLQFTFVRFMNRETFDSEKEIKGLLKKYGKVKEQYQDITDNAFDIIQSIDKSGKFLYVNKQWENILGYSEKDIKALTVFDIIKDTDLNKYLNAIELVKKKNEDQRVQIHLLKKNKSSIIIDATISALLDKEGEIISTREIFRDITAQIEIENEMKKNSQELKSLNQTLVGRELKMIELKKKLKDLGYTEEGEE